MTNFPVPNMNSDRLLALVDIENLLRCRPSTAEERDFEHAIARLAAAAGLTASDKMVVGSAPRSSAVFGVRHAWPTALVRVRSGLDGADMALSDELRDLSKLAKRHGTVVIGSGDHHFVPFVNQLEAAGIHTVVVSWPQNLSRELRRAAGEVIYLTDVPSRPVTMQLAA